jgi:hypothetical protein
MRHWRRVSERTAGHVNDCEEALAGLASAEAVAAKIFTVGDIMTGQSYAGRGNIVSPGELDDLRKGGAI